MKLNSRYVPLLATTAVLILLYLAGCLAYPRFGSLRVIVNLFDANAYLGIAALGATFVILSGGIDLSVGSMIAFTGILIARLVDTGTPPLVAMVIALIVGPAFGAGMGTLIHFYKLPPFLVTLGGMFFLRGLGFVVHPQNLAIKHPFYTETLFNLSIPLNGPLVWPITATCFVITVVAATWLSVFTRLGRNIYALGSSETSAALMGISVGATKVQLYALAGFFSALAGVVATFFKSSGDPASFVGLELDAIAATVIGGTLLTGGVGFLPGTMMGVLILGLIQTLINFQGTLNSWWTRIAVGALLLAFILLQRLIATRGLRSGN